MKNNKSDELKVIQNDIYKIKKLDKFYTKKTIIKKIIKNINQELFDLIIEPSAGNGNFLKYLDKNKTISFDIEPENINIKKQDWFKYNINKNFKKVLIIGNPPFGKNNILSLKFLKHSFSFKNVYEIAFILPNVYKKYTKQKIIPSNFYIKKIIDLGKNPFLLGDKEYHVPCSFFIFTKDKVIDLRTIKKETTKDFKFTNKNDKYDFFIFGAAPKKIIKNPQKNNRGYFIKSLIEKKILLNNFKNINWKGNSSANGGVFWLTKTEIINNYEKYFEEFKWIKK